MKNNHRRQPAPMKRTGMTATNAVEPAAPASVWGYKGCAGKGMPATNNSFIADGVFDRELKEYHATQAKC